MKKDEKPPSTITSRIIRGILNRIPLISTRQPEEMVVDLRDPASKRANEIMQQSLNAGNLQVRDIMIPRASMITVAETDSIEKLAKLVTSTGHSRIPVLTQDGLDAMGVVHIKDVIPHLLQRAKKTQPAKLADLLRDCMVVPESKSVLAMLDSFLAVRGQMAIVLDEYGNVSGLVTTEDVLEELVGEIIDEHDQDTQEYIQEDEEHGHIVSGDTSLEDFNEFFGTDFDAPSTSTIAGWLSMHLGRLPKVKEEMQIDHLKIEVAQSNKRVVTEIYVDIEKDSNADNDGDQEPTE